MLLSQRPLTAAPADADIALGTRVELAKRVARNARRGRNTLVLGPRGSGRTSLLSLVERHLRQGDVKFVRRVDAEACDDAMDLVAALLAALGADPRRDTARTVTWRERHGLTFMDDRQEIVRRFANETDAARVVDASRTVVPEGGTGILLIDNLHPGPGHDVFGRFRDTLWAAPIVWVAAGDGNRNGYLDPPADAFWEAVVWLEPLDGDEVSELLSRRIEAASAGDDDARTIANLHGELVELLEGASPREVLRAAADAAEAGTIVGGKEAPERWGRAHAAGGRSGSMLLAEIERLGRPVHAGDEELLRRMGLTRPRIVQLLNALEQARLLERHRQGKRILFELVP